MVVTGGFNIAASTATRGIADNKTWQISEDLTLVRGRHQIGARRQRRLLGHAAEGVGERRRQLAVQRQHHRAWHGGLPARPRGDFRARLVFRRASQSAYQGWYAQDTWRASERLTLNAGVRWEPYLGQQITDGAIANFSRENFSRGIKSTQFVNAPAGFIYPGDEGFPEGRSGYEKQWKNLSPRVGLAWDVLGNGSMSVRSSYGLNYDFPIAESWFRLAAGPPYGNLLRLTDPPGRMDAPYEHLGGDPHPITTHRNTPFPPFGAFGAVTPDIRSPRTQSWNASIERQLGANWGASVSYLGSYSDRLWGAGRLQPGRVSRDRAVRDCRRLVSSVHDGGEPEQPAPAVPAEPAGGAVHRQPRRVRRCRIAGLPRAEDLGAAAVGGRASASMATTRCRAASASTGRTPAAMPAASRTRTIPNTTAAIARRIGTHIVNATLGYQTPEVGERGVECARVELARLGHPERAVGQLAAR